MNVFKLALLGTAAVAAVSVSARADDLADLKGQIEALNRRIASFETNATVPAGYQLLSVSEADAIIIPSIEDNAMFYGKKATNIGILPTADVPASANIQWSGSVAAGIVFDKSKTSVAGVAGGLVTTTQTTTFTGPGGTFANVNTNTNTNTGVFQFPGLNSKSKALDVRAKARLKVVATTDTAVGEVGVRINFQANANSAGAFNTSGSAVKDDGYWGWWKMTPELTLGGGVDGSLAGNGQGFDGKATAVFAGGDGNGGYNHAGGDPAQIRLSYSSGPLAFALALEDGDNAGGKSALGVAGEVKYTGDMIGFELNAGMWDHKGGAGTDLKDRNWTVNAGANIGLGDIATLSIAAGIGEDSNFDSDFVGGDADKYTKASAHLGFTLSDAVAAELGVSWKDYKGSSASTSIGAGLYYTPVSQLTLGLEAGHTKGRVSFSEPGPFLPVADDGGVRRDTKDSTSIAFVTVYRF